jgi:branched-chain amino acid transport system substrate-binding protein
LPLARPASAQAPSSPGPSGEIAKLTVGVVLPLTGAQAAYGQEALRGIEVALDRLRQLDPALGAHVTILPGDDQSSTTAGAAVAERMIAKDRAHALIGSLSGPATAALAGVARAKGIPLLVPFVEPTGVPRGLPVFPVALDAAGQGAGLATYAAAKLGDVKLATLAPDMPDARATVDGFAAALKAQGKTLAASETYDLATDDYTVPLYRLRDAKARVVLLPASSSVAADVMQQAAKLKVPLRFLGGDGWDTPDLAKAGGAGNALTAHFAADDPAPEVVAFVAAYKTKNGRTPGALAALGYDALNTLVDAFRRTNSNLKDQLVGALARTRDLPGATGVLSLNELGELHKTAVIKTTTATGLVFAGRFDSDLPPGAAGAAPAAKPAAAVKLPAPAPVPVPVPAPVPAAHP